jgi:membrane-associated phospholipid phosphatase
MNRVFLEEIWDRLRTTRLSNWFTTKFPRGSNLVAGRLLWSGPLGLKLTLGVAAAALCWFIFFGIVQDLVAGDPLIRSDLRVVTFLQTMRAPGLNAVMVFFTYLGNWQIIVGTAIAFAALLYMRQKWWWLISFLAAFACGEATMQLVKLGFGRSRPDLQNAILPAAGASFPSGHTLASMVVYGTLTIYLMSRVERVPVKFTIAFLGTLTIALVGFSRVYLGVHWPSDVLASFALGAAWIFTCMGATSIIFSRRKTQPFGIDAGRWWFEPASAPLVPV